MFRRRLVALMALSAAATGVLVVQLSRLTVVQGAENRHKAEAKLLTREWTPPGGPGRGRILDRKGRILAQDRPSLDLTIEYRVLTGGKGKPSEWVMRKAGAAARKFCGEQWKRSGAEERVRLMDPYIAVYQAHVERMWQDVVRLTGIPDERVHKAAEEIVQRVTAKGKYLYAVRLHSEMDARLARGEEISAEVEDEIGDRIRRPIAEERSSHVLLPNISDDAGFELMGLCGQKGDLQIPDGKGGFVLDQGVPRMPGLAVVPSGDRDYPFDQMNVELDLSTLPEPVKGKGTRVISVDGVAYHVLGRMKDEAQKEDNDRRAAHRKADAAFAERVEIANPRRDKESDDRGQYFDDDPAGQSGIEGSQEDMLRGLRGLRIQQLDTGETTTLPPERGRDVQLTMDIMLQARVQAAMSPALGLAVAQQWHGSDNPTIPDGTPLNGAAVVMEVDTGDIMALVSTPSISREVLREHPERVFEDLVNREVDVPWIDRAIARPYPPGSIAKAMILNGAVKFGKFNLDSAIDCTGHLFPDKPNMFRCWIYKAHGGATHTGVLGHALSAPEALMVSCNIFFFTLGQRLGPQGVMDTYRMFGVDHEPWNLGLGAEFGGELGEPNKGGGRKPLAIQDAIQMGIGQGPVAWTPLHAADAYCTLARGGIRVRPHIVNEPTSPETEDLRLDRRAVKEAMHGLWLSANDMGHGTGAYLNISGRAVSHWNAPNVAVWGKTGTASAPTIRVEPFLRDPKTKVLTDVPNPLWDKGVEAPAIAEASKNPEFTLPKGTRAVRWGDHSWFVVLVGNKGENRPKYAIAVMMEYAGSGGKVSGPIVNQIIHALVTEGYL